ncbi:MULTISPECIES: rod shape-determining protein MreD [unclassified Acinetobacter]|uniref:rod shape-determining protein MreD n=1 Tax=unclassified Acinetobacter TaxID=196816 RepID=UPI0035B90714
MSVVKKESFAQHRDPLWAIIISVMIASVLTVYPLPFQISNWRPSFMLMVVFFWVMCQPVWTGVWFAFAIGLVTDLLLEMPLGLNALLFVIISYAVRYFTREKRIMTQLQLWLIFAMCVLIYGLIVLGFLLASGAKISILSEFQSIITSIVIWPLLYWLLKRWRAV